MQVEVDVAPAIQILRQCGTLDSRVVTHSMVGFEQRPDGQCHRSAFGNCILQLMGLAVRGSAHPQKCVTRADAPKHMPGSLEVVLCL